MADGERAKALAELSDEQIDYSETPPLDDDFFASATPVEKKSRTELISIRSVGHRNVFLLSSGLMVVMAQTAEISGVMIFPTPHV